jgi:hypothetical protein
VPVPNPDSATVPLGLTTYWTTWPVVPTWNEFTPASEMDMETADPLVL